MKYYVSYMTVASAGVEIEADSAEEAAELADEAFSPPHLCHQETVELDDDWDIDYVEEVSE